MAAPKPLLTACLIVKDEAEVIERCLGSLGPWVDEVVVYDTGSTDGTQQLAEQAGATVVQGGWSDDFAIARNQALEHVSGRWALSIDADEVITQVDGDALRDQLRRSKADAMQVTMDSYRDASGAIAATHQNMRLLRPGRAHWQGRLHEQVRAVRGALSVEMARHLRMGHWGYTPEAIAAKDKLNRNVAIAEKSLADTGDDVRSIVELGRALAAAGRDEEALARFAEVRDLHGQGPVPPYVVRTAARQAVQSLLHLGRPDETGDWLQTLRDASDGQGTADLLEARALAAAGEVDRALDLAGSLAARDVIEDDDGIAATGPRARVAIATQLMEAGHADAGVDLLLDADDDIEIGAWPALIEHLAQRGQLERVADRLGPDRPDDWIERVMAGLVTARVEGLAELLDVLDARWPDAQHLLALASLAAPVMSFAQATRWSERLNALGLSVHAPLQLWMADDDRPARDRVLAAAKVMEQTDGEEGLALLQQLAPVVEETALRELLGDLDELAHPGLEPFILAAITTPERCLAMAEALAAHDEPKVAGDILTHALETMDPDPALRGQLAVLQSQLAQHGD